MSKLKIRITLVEDAGGRKVDLGVYREDTLWHAQEAARRRYSSLFRNLGTGWHMEGSSAHDYEPPAKLPKLRDTTLPLLD